MNLQVGDLLIRGAGLGAEGGDGIGAHATTA